MGMKTDGEEMGPGLTVTDGVKNTKKSGRFEQETENENGLFQDAEGDVGIEERKMTKGTGIPLITSLQNMPSHHTPSALNTEHNEAQRGHTNGGSSVRSNTPTSLQPGADIEDEKTALSYLVNLNTDTSADDKCVKLEECSSPLQLGEIMEILETDSDTNDDWDAMYNTLMDTISPSDASSFIPESPFNPDIDQMDEEGYTPLYQAALEGDLECVQDLISRGANPNKPSKGGLRPLHAAAQEGHARIVDNLILQGADVNVGCEQNRTPLHTAAAKGNVDILEIFIAEEANVNIEDHTGWTPFNAAVHYGHLEAVKCLMTQGAKQNRYDGISPMYIASLEGHLDVVKYFISKGYDVNVEDDKGKIPLHGAAARGHVKIINYLIQHDSDINKGDAKGWTPFNAAVQNGHLEAVKYLTTKGAKQNRYDEMTPLYTAARLGHLDIVRFLVSKGADVNEEDDSGMIPLHGAAGGGHLKVMEYLIQQGSDVNKINVNGWTPFDAAVPSGHLEAVRYLITEGAKQIRFDDMTPLYVAASFGHLDIIKFFISKGADVNKENDNGRIPLHGAAMRGHMKVMKYLIQQGSDVNKADVEGWTPFNAAVQYGHLGTVKYLMTKGAKQNRYNGMTPLFAAAQLGHLDIVRFIIFKGADVNEEDDEAGMSPLHGAAAQGHLKVMEYLIQQGSDVNKKDTTGWTPFNAAVQFGQLEAVKCLMSKGAKQNRFDGMTPLYVAAQFGYLDIVEFFIAEGTDVNEEDDDGMIPLHGAADGGHIKVMEYLIHQGSDTNKNDNDGWTPLHAAVRNGRLEVIKVLLAKGALGTSFEGLTLLYIATQYDHVDVVKFLVSSGYDVNGRNECGKSPLHAACYIGNMDIVKVLVHHNANTNEQDHDGWTPLHAAAQEGHQDIVDYLTLNGADMSLKDIDGLKPLQATVYTGHQHVKEGISPRRGELGEVELGDPRAGGHHNLTTRGNVAVSVSDADTQSRTEQFASQVDIVDDGNDCTQAENAERGADELSLKSLPTRTHGDEKGDREEHNPFIHAKLKYPEKVEQDPMRDQMEANRCTGTRKRDTFTHDTDWSSPRRHQTWQYSGPDLPYLQTMDNGGHLYEEPESRCHSLIDENRELRESSSPMNVGNDLPINETSVKVESFHTHPPAVDGNPVSTQGTSSNPVWKIGTKLQTSVHRCPSIMALAQTFLQMMLALVIILAGSPVLVAGTEVTERVTLQAGELGVVPFYFQPSDTSQDIPFYTLRFESNPRSFSVNGKADIGGFKNPSQIRRFSTSVTDLDTSPCVNLIINNVDTLDEDGYVLRVVWKSSEHVRYETIKKEVNVKIPPGRAKCFITLSGNVDYPYEVHCRTTTGSVTTTLSCYQNDRKIDVKGNITDNGQVTSGIFWIPDYTHFSCCSHDVTLNVSQTMCNDFVWPHGKETTKQAVNTDPTSVTTPTPQVESHVESGACRQLMLPSLMHFTYLFVYILFFFTMY